MATTPLAAAAAGWTGHGAEHRARPAVAAGSDPAGDPRRPRFDEHAIEGALLRYELDGAPLDGVVSADWDATGRLLLATDSGRIEVREHQTDGALSITWSHDLNGLEPAPAPAPPFAERW